MNPSRRLFLLSPLALPLWSAQPASSPLWLGSKYTHEQKSKAIQRGLEFIYSSARKKKNFNDFGHDYLWCFYSISVAALDPKLKELAWKMGQERALLWRMKNPHVPANPGPNTIIELCFGGYCADSFGLRDTNFKKALQVAAATHPAAAYLGFNPTNPILTNLPKSCSGCKRVSPQGSTNCVKCSRPLKMKDPYAVLCDALITTYSGDRYGVQLGASYADVVKLIPLMRPYREPNGKDDAGFYNIVYAITHIVYTLNDYGLYQLDPAWIPQEFEFLKTHLRQYIEENDPETIGEFLDTLKSLGLTEQDQLIQHGEEFLLSRQNADGSWGDPKDKDNYNRYHSTWTAIGGLLDYDWRGQRVSFPEALVSLGVRI